MSTPCLLNQAKVQPAFLGDLRLLQIQQDKGTGEIYISMFRTDLIGLVYPDLACSTFGIAETSQTLPSFQLNKCGKW